MSTYRGKPCRYGHTERYMTTGACVQCRQNHAPSARQYSWEAAHRRALRIFEERQYRREPDPLFD